MSFAVELYTSLRIGISLRGISKILKKAFNVKVSYEGIRKWVLASKPMILRLKKSVSTIWHADETYFKIKGNGYWLWVVFCAETKQVLSWHISKKRLLKDCILLFKKAKKVAGGNPETIITDGLYQYDTAIKKVMFWRYHERKRKHIIDSGIGKNALIERLNREIKRRIKWFSTFQSLEGANAFFGLWFYHYNLVKSQYLT